MNHPPRPSFRRPSEKVEELRRMEQVEELRRMEQVEGEWQRSAQRMRYLFSALLIGVVPVALYVAGDLGDRVPLAGLWLGAFMDSLGFLSLFALLPAQFVVIHKAGNSVYLRDSDRLLIAVFCALFSVAPFITVALLSSINW